MQGGMRPEERSAKVWAEIKKILTSTQVSRLKGIELQVVGYRAVADPKSPRPSPFQKRNKTKSTS